MLVEQLVALSSVVIVGGAIVGIVFKLLLGRSKEDELIDELKAEFKQDPSDKKSKKKK